MSILTRHPAAEAVQNGSVLLQKGVSHPAVSLCGIGLAVIVPSRTVVGVRIRAGTIWSKSAVRHTGKAGIRPVLRNIAIVVLQAVNSPRRKRRRINRFISNAGRITCASLGSGTGVDSNLQTHGMDVVCKTTDALWKLGGIWRDPAGGVIPSRLDRPAIIDVDVLVASGLEAFVDDVLGGRQEAGFVDVAAVGIPAIPSLQEQGGGRHCQTWLGRWLLAKQREARMRPWLPSSRKNVSSVLQRSCSQKSTRVPFRLFCPRSREEMGHSYLECSETRKRSRVPSGLFYLGDGLGMLTAAAVSKMALT
jgi:hypothetical protein